MTKNSLYLDLMKKTLVNFPYLEGDQPFEQHRLTSAQYENFEWKIPPTSRPHTLLAVQQLNNLERLMMDTIACDVPGNYIEAGVYRGGAVIFMRAILKSLNILDRDIWVADSFEGIPHSTKYTDILDEVNEWPDRWIASIDEVKSNFSRYGLLDEQVQFLKGYFSTTLPDVPFGDLALVRLDADSYESTMDAMDYLYPKISVGGYLIIDDWGLKGCRQAIMDYRKTNNVHEHIQLLNGTYGAADEKSVYEAYWKVAN